MHGRHEWQEQFLWSMRNSSLGHKKVISENATWVKEFGSKLNSSRITFHAVVNGTIGLGAILTQVMRKFLPSGVPEDLGFSGRVDRPSTGTIAVIAALSLCVHVDAYGFHDPKVTYLLPDKYYDELFTGIWYYVEVFKCAYKDFFRIVYPGIFVGHTCSNGDVQNFHALRPAEHELLTQISSSTRELIFRTAKMSFPSFALTNCSQIPAPVPLEVEIDPGTVTRYSDGRFRSRFHLIAGKRHKAPFAYLALALACVFGSFCVYCLWKRMRYWKVSGRFQSVGSKAFN